MKNWDDLQYNHLYDQENKVTVEAVGARYDSNSGTIIWNRGNTFNLKFKLEEKANHEEKYNSIFDNSDENIALQYALHFFKFSIYSIYGAKEEALYEVKDILMNDNGEVSVTIDSETSSRIKAGIYSYSLLAYRSLEDTLDTRTVIGRKQGKIHVLS